MEDYQQRVITEKEELDVRINKLVSFLFSSKSPSTKEQPFSYLYRQLEIMMEYSRILKMRIEDF